ncbi:MAG: hypothetical protein ACLTV2_07360 [Acutalibacter sp.]
MDRMIDRGGNGPETGFLAPKTILPIVAHNGRFLQVPSRKAAQKICCNAEGNPL